MTTQHSNTEYHFFPRYQSARTQRELTPTPPESVPAGRHPTCERTRADSEERHDTTRHDTIPYHTTLTLTGFCKRCKSTLVVLLSAFSLSYPLLFGIQVSSCARDFVAHLAITPRQPSSAKARPSPLRPKQCLSVEDLDVWQSMMNEIPTTVKKPRQFEHQLAHESGRRLTSTVAEGTTDLPSYKMIMAERKADH